MKNLKILAIGSFATHGMISLKSAMIILKEHILPVPTVILSGPANMPGVQKHPVEFKELLEETVNLIILRKQRIILYIGYLGTADQAEVILNMIDTYKNEIEMILADPIMADHGKLYVTKEVADRWQAIIRKSNFAFPNSTELKLLTGQDLEKSLGMEFYIESFAERFPNVNLVVTSVLSEDTKTGISMACKDYTFTYTHDLLPKNYSGTGDAFVSFFIRFHFYENVPLAEALKSAADKIYASILFSIHSYADELLLVPDK